VAKVTAKFVGVNAGMRIFVGAGRRHVNVKRRRERRGKRMKNERRKTPINVKRRENERFVRTTL
jgi:hypothetical protein